MNYNEIADALKASGNEEALKLIKNKLCSTESGRAEYEEAIKEKDFYDLQDKLRYIKDSEGKSLELTNIIEIHMDMIRFYKEMLVVEKGINPKFLPSMAYPLTKNNNAIEVNALAVDCLLNYVISKDLEYPLDYYGVPIFHKMSKQCGNIPQTSLVFVDSTSKEAETFMKSFKAVCDTYYRRYKQSSY